MIHVEYEMDMYGRKYKDMDEIDREMIALRHFEEVKNGEAAELLGLERSNLYRKMKSLGINPKE